ncbi:MAG: hypothetical protein GHCLOJNM_00561 [bacterium]|nr:hypothetical protein [bacterium]
MDCLFPFASEKAIDILFSYEVIQPNRRGGTTDIVDMLIRNVSPDRSEISDIFFLHPSRLFGTDPEVTARFQELITNREEADRKVRRQFERFATLQTDTLLLDPPDATTEHLRIDGFIELKVAESQQVKVRLYDPDPRRPVDYVGKVCHSWLGTPVGLDKDCWEQLQQIGYALLQLRLASPLLYGEACWVRIALRPPQATLLSKPKGVVDSIFPKGKYCWSRYLKHLFRGFGVGVTYTAFVVGPFDVREKFRQALQIAQTRHKESSKDMHCLRQIEEKFCTRGTHDPQTKVAIRDCWIMARPRKELAIIGATPNGDIVEHMLPLDMPLTLDSRTSDKAIFQWKSGFVHFGRKDPQEVGRRALEHLRRYATDPSKARPKEVISEALQVPARLCADVIDLLERENLVGKTVNDPLPGYYSIHPDRSADHLAWPVLYSHEDALLKFTVRIGMNRVHTKAPLWRFLYQTFVLLVALLSLFLAYLGWSSRASP